VKVCSVLGIVDQQGTPREIHIDGCPKRFEKASRTAVEQWQWIPVIVDGHPRESVFQVYLKFIP
jgi:hypothetical protein